MEKKTNSNSIISNSKLYYQQEFKQVVSTWNWDACLQRSSLIGSLKDLSYLLILVLKSFMTDGTNFSKYCVSITVSMSELWTLLNAEVPRWLKFMLAVSPCCWAGLGLGWAGWRATSKFRVTSRHDRERGLSYWGLQIFCGENSHMADSNHAKWFAGWTNTNISVSLLFSCTSAVCTSCCILPQRKPISSLANSSTREPRTSPRSPAKVRR